MQQQPQKVKTSEEIEKYWDEFSNSYSDSLSPSLSALTISMLTMLEVEKSNKILEVAVGPGYQIPYLLQRKKPEAQLYLTDLACEFLPITGKRIENFLDSKLDQVYNIDYKQLQPYQGPMKYDKVNTFVQQANSEKLSDFQDNTFDTYISSLCLQITSDPQKMIEEAYRVLAPGGRACFSVWGDISRSTMLRMTPMVLKKNNIPLPNERSNFHLNDRNKLIDMFESIGFTDTLCWDQYIPMNLVTNQKQAEEFLTFSRAKKQLSLVPEDKKEDIKKQIIQAYVDILKEEKRCCGLDTLVIMVTKPQ